MHTSNSKEDSDTSQKLQVLVVEGSSRETFECSTDEQKHALKEIEKYQLGKTLTCFTYQFNPNMYSSSDDSVINVEVKKYEQLEGCIICIAPIHSQFPEKGAPVSAKVRDQIVLFLENISDYYAPEFQDVSDDPAFRGCGMALAQ